MITIPYLFTPRDYQLNLFRALDGIQGKPETKIKRAILKWHRRAGKDKACFCYMIKEAYQDPGNYYYIFPTSADARRALWETIDGLTGMKVIDHIPVELKAKIRNQEMIIELPTADGRVSIIRIIGYDTDPDSLRGITCKGAVLSEWGFSSPDVLKNLMPSLMQAKGWLIINSTPNGRNHYYDLWNAVQLDDEWYVSELQTLWPDRANYSGLVQQSELDSLVRTGIHTKEEVEREFGVSFDTNMEGSIYTFQLDQAQEQGRICTLPYITSKPVYASFDIGQGDTTAIWFFQESPNTIDFIDFFEATGMGTNAIAKELKNLGYEYAAFLLPHDAAHKSQGKEITSFRLDFEESLKDYRVDGEVIVVEKTQSVAFSIIETRKRMNCYRFDSINCVTGLDHLANYKYAYNKKTKSYSPKPNHNEHSNAADALRMEQESISARAGCNRKDFSDVIVDTYNIWDF